MQIKSRLMYKNIGQVYLAAVFASNLFKFINLQYFFHD
jgi:hypothetical protein